LGVHVVGSVDDLPEGGHLIVQVGDRSIGVLRHRNRLYALSNRCPHQGGPVCQGGVFGAHLADILPGGHSREYVDEARPVVACPWHGWEFDLDTGGCLADPRRGLRRYEVRQEGTQILVSI
jgi:nitrite reductase (NADH) small subunit